MFRKPIATSHLLALLFATAASASPIPGLHNTGVDDLGVVLADGAVDPHYALIASADPSFPGPNAIAANPIPSGFWIANNALSRWISPTANQAYPSGGTAHPGGAYTFRLVVDLSGLDPATAEIHGTWAADNSGAIHFNGSATANAVGGFGSLAAFSVASGFVAGINHLDFVVTNANVGGGVNPIGLRVQGIGGTATGAVSVLEGADAMSFGFLAPFPNPTRASAHIQFALPRDAVVRLLVRDLSGRTVRTLLEGDARAGRFESSWDGRAADGSRAAAGVYFVDLLAEGRRESRPVVLLR